MADQPQQKIQIKIDEKDLGGTYANAVSISINNNEVVLDFGYKAPSTGEPIIKVVSRVNMSHQTARSLMTTLSNALLDHQNRQKEANEKKKSDE